MTSAHLLLANDYLRQSGTDRHLISNSSVASGVAAPIYFTDGELRQVTTGNRKVLRSTKTYSHIRSAFNNRSDNSVTGRYPLLLHHEAPITSNVDLHGLLSTQQSSDRQSLLFSIYHHLPEQQHQQLPLPALGFCPHRHQCWTTSSHQQTMLQPLGTTSSGE